MPDQADPTLLPDTSAAPSSPTSPSTTPYPVNISQPVAALNQVSLDPAVLAETAARQLYTAGMTHLGQAPNPQLVSEAIAAGAAPDVAQSFSDPSMAPYAQSQPQGFGAQPNPAPNGPSQPGQNLDSFDWNAYWTKMHGDLQNNQAWQKFGEVPQFNFGYIQGVMNSGADAGKKWQAMLQDRGYLAQGHATDGAWDDDTKTALQGFYTAMALPVALYGRDPQAKAQASLFLQRYTGINAIDLQSQKRNDPSFQSQVVENWTMTQGPDRQRDAIHDFVDQFGKENVPQTIQDIADPGFLTDLAQTAWSPVGGILGLIATGVAKVSGKDVGITSWLQGHSPAALAEQNVQSKLTDADKAMLDPALKQLNASSGFLPLTWWDQQRNNVILAAKYSFEDMAHGKSTNPLDAFDATSDIGKRIGQHHDDIMAGLFGDQWVKDHPTASLWGGMLANMIDDPLSYLGAEGVVAKGGIEGGLTLEKGLLGVAKQTAGVTARTPGALAKAAVATARLVARPRTMAEAASPALRDIAANWWAPRAATQRAAVDGILKARQAGNGFNVARLLGADNAAYHAEPEIKAAIDKIMDPATNANQIRAIMNDTFSHKWQGTHNIYNRIAAMESMVPDALRKMGDGHVSKLRALGSFKSAGRELDMSDRGLYQSAHTIEEMLAIAGAKMTPHTVQIVDEAGNATSATVRGIDEVMAKLWGFKTESERTMWVTHELPAIFDSILKSSANKGEKALTVTDVMLAEQKHNRGRSFEKFQNQGLQSTLGAAGKVERPTYMITPKGAVHDAKEESVYFTQGGHQQDAINEIQASLDELITSAVKSLRAKNPGMDAVAAEKLAIQANKKVIEHESSRIEKLQASVEEQRPGSFATGQQSQRAVLPFTSYGLMTALHPKLSRVEDVQSAVRLDAVTSAWKGMALMRPSTTARMVVGDDTMRTAIHLAFNGNAKAGIEALLVGTTKGLAAPFALLARGAQNKLGRAAAKKGVAKFGAAKDEAGKVTFTDKDVQWIKAGVETLNKHLENLDVLKFMRDFDGDNFDVYAPHQVGYQNAFKQTFGWMTKSPELVAWAQAEAKYKGSGLKALQQAYKDKVGGTEEILRKQQMDAEEYADKVNQHMLAFTQQPGILDMLASKHFDQAALDKMVKKNNINKLLPNVGGAAPTAHASNAVVRALTEGPGSLFHAMATPVVSAARADNFKRLQRDYAKRIAKAHPEWDPAMVQRLADGDSAQWMRQNLYQGQRSIAGQFARNVFPFGGATANMSRFWMREAKAHPWMYDPGAHELIAAEQSSASGGHKETGIAGNVLGALGFAGTDGLNADFSHATFLSSDGIASFVPGFGPIFSPVAAWADKNQAVHDVLQEIPGIKDQMKLADEGTTLIPSFIGQDTNALTEAVFGKSLTGPAGLGVDANRNDQAIDNKYKQLLTDYQAGRMDHMPTRDDAVKSLGRDELATGALGAVAPINPSITDERKTEIAQASTEMRAATNPAAQQQVIANHPEIAAYLKYVNPSTSLAEKDKIATDPNTHWVVAYATSNTETDDPSIPKPSNLTDYDTALSLGNLHVLGVDGLQTKITKATNFNAGWAAYDSQVVNLENTWLQQTGNTKTSKAYRDFSKQIIEPILQKLKDNNPDWFAQFIASRSQPKDQLGLQLKTEPLRSLMSWEVIPQSSSLETDKTVMWRKALTYRDAAAAAINQVIANGGASEQKQAIMDGLQQRLGDLEGQNPEFADELKLYAFNKWQDIVNTQAMAERG